MLQVITYRQRLEKKSNRIFDRFSWIRNTAESDSAKWWEISLMFLLLSITGNPFIGIKEYHTFLQLSMIIPLVHVIRNYNKPLSYRTIFIFVFLIGYELMHAAMFELDYSLTIIKLSMVLILSIAIADILKDQFVFVLTKTMVLISLVSFFFVIVSYTPLHSVLYKLGLKLFPVDEYNNIRVSTILVFTFSWEYFEGVLPYVRNCGIFWEGGAFAVFLNITLFLHYSTKKLNAIQDLLDKDAFILILAVLSTTSTMGVLALMILLTFYSLQFKSAVKYLLLMLIIITGYLAFTTVDFIGEKINDQLRQSGSSNNRFGSAIKDFENISERPFLGWSRRIEVVFNTTVASAKTHRPNGFTNFLRNYGLVYFTVYFTLVFFSFKNIYYYHHHSHNLFVPLFGVFLLFIVSFSEVIFDLAFLKSLIFLYPSYYASTEIRPAVAAKSHPLVKSFSLLPLPKR
jgi:hypothetical protein